MDASNKLQAEVLAKRAVIKAARVLRIPTAYMQFFAIKYKALKAENPTATAVEIARLIGKQWKRLNESEKQLFKAPTAVGEKVVAKQ